MKCFFFFQPLFETISRTKTSPALKVAKWPEMDKYPTTRWTWIKSRGKVTFLILIQPDPGPEKITQKRIGHSRNPFLKSPACFCTKQVSRPEGDLESFLEVYKSSTEKLFSFPLDRKVQNAVLLLGYLRPCGISFSNRLLWVLQQTRNSQGRMCPQEHRTFHPAPS